MRFETISEGFVFNSKECEKFSVAAGPRSVFLDDGEIICTYMIQSALGINDFVPMISRSKDGGITWKVQGPIWPELQDKYSIFCSISRSSQGELFLYGTRTKIDQKGESFWCDELLGLKENKLFWSKSTDNGYTWSEQKEIPMKIPGAAEAPGAMCITRNGDWIVVYSPCNTFDPTLKVDRNQVVALCSRDNGITWEHTSMLRFENINSGGAEAWAIELADGRLLGTCWHQNYDGDCDYPNPYAISNDQGRTWMPFKYTNIMGQSTSLAPLPDGRAIMAYNQRKYGELAYGLQLQIPVKLTLVLSQILWYGRLRQRRKADWKAIFTSGWIFLLENQRLPCCQTILYC